MSTGNCHSVEAQSNIVSGKHAFLGRVESPDRRLIILAW
jgi:hypothetical protein